MKEKNTQTALRRVVLVLAVIALVMSATLAALLARKALRGRDETPPETAAPAGETPAPASDAPESVAAQAADVQKLFDDFVAAQGGTWDLYYESLTTGETASARCGHDSEPRSVAASLIKLYVMGAVYDAVARGTLTHDAVYQSVYSMITASDNDACNRLVTMLGGGDPVKGMQAVNAFAASIGCTGTQMNRLMLQPGTENFVTASECGAMLRLIYRGACVSADASAEMLTILKAQTVNDRIPASLPQGTAVAHKTGNLINLSCGDAGIVLAPGGDYILCAIANHEPSDAQATSAIATLSRTVYNAVTA